MFRKRPRNAHRKFIARAAVLVACGILAVACSKSTPDNASGKDSGADPIAALVEKLSADRSADWARGSYPDLDMPAAVSVETLFNRMFQRTAFDEGYVTEYKILELRRVVIAGRGPQTYTAALVDTDLGRKVVLFRVEQQDWWTRVFDVAPSA